jgi:hypothetical protein
MAQWFPNNSRTGALDTRPNLVRVLHYLTTPIPFFLAGVPMPILHLKLTVQASDVSPCKVLSDALDVPLPLVQRATPTTPTKFSIEGVSALATTTCHWHPTTATPHAVTSSNIPHTGLSKCFSASVFAVIVKRTGISYGGIRGPGAFGTRHYARG